MTQNRISSIVREARRRGMLGVLTLYVVGAWVVLQVSSTLFPGWRIAEEAIRYVWIGTLLLCPVALIVGWRYDVSMQGVYRTSDDESNPAGEALARKDFAILAALGLVTLSVVTGVVVETSRLRIDVQELGMAANIPENSIAVLPFVNMSDDADNEYFSDGITEQLLNDLARIPSLHVAARTSSFYFKDKVELMQTMGEKLGVRTLLEGSVRKSGNNIRITAQLINASDGFHLWSETYDRQMDDVFAVQDEIASAIVATLRLKLLGQEQERLERNITRSPEAFDIYLRAMQARLRSDKESLDLSIELLQRAIELDDEFAYAYDALAYGYLLKFFNGSMPQDEATGAARELLDRALKLRPDLEEAHASMGLLKSVLKRYAESDAHYETALAINPNYFGGQVNYGLSLVWQSRLKEGSAAYIRAQALDPLNANLSFNIGALMMLQGEADTGLEFMQRSLDINAEQSRPKAAMTHWLAIYGRLYEAIKNGREVLDSFPDDLTNISALSRAYLLIGTPQEATDLVRESLLEWPGNAMLRNAERYLTQWSGDQQAFIDLADDEFQELDVNVGDALNAQMSGRVFRQGLATLLQGDNQRAEELFYWVAGGEEGIESKQYDDMQVLKMLALAYRRLDRIDASDALINQCLALAGGARESGWATPSLFFRLAEVYAIAGDLENAVLNLEIAFEKGWRNLAAIEHGIFWQQLQDEPEISRIKVKILEDLEQQKQRLQSEVAAQRAIESFAAPALPA